MTDPTEEFREAAGLRGDSTTGGSGIIGAFLPGSGAVSVNPRIDAPDLSADDIGTARRLFESYGREVTANERRANQGRLGSLWVWVLILAGLAAAAVGGS